MTGDDIRNARSAAGMSQADFALFAGVTRGMIGRAERWGAYPPRLATDGWTKIRAAIDTLAQDKAGGTAK